jgi:multidrug resistance efflux pump
MPDFHTEEVQEILGTPPNWLIQWGISLTCGVLLVLLALSMLIQYPDIISAEVQIIPSQAPIRLVARSSGKIHFLIQDNSQVLDNQVLAYIDNSADWQAIQSLSLALKPPKSPEGGLNSSPSFGGGWGEALGKLGELQTPYENWHRAVINYQNYLALGQTSQELQSLQTQIGQYQQINQNLTQQTQLMNRELALSQKRFHIDSSLTQQKVIAPLDLDKIEANLLQQTRALKNTEAGVLSNHLTIRQLQAQVQELKLQNTDKLQQLTAEVHSNFQNLQSQYEQWQARYVIRTPIGGKVSFLQYWQDNQFVRAEEALLVVVPPSQHYLGKLELPMANSGKVQVGQCVHIRLANYPSEQYGMIVGKVQNIAMVSNENPQKQTKNYVVTINLAKGLKTSYNKVLPKSADLQGQAEIITEERSLFLRFFQQLQKLLNY